jgi:hypothetical protein
LAINQCPALDRRILDRFSDALLYVIQLAAYSPASTRWQIDPRMTIQIFTLR